MSLFESHQYNDEDSDSWISISDMMAGLMVIFLFIAITYIRPVLEQQSKITEIAVAFTEAEGSILDSLKAEFDNDLEKWNAEIDTETLSVRFKAPDVLFDPGRSALKPTFKNIIDDFFPRYLSVLSTHQEHVEEIRIEGHTSTDWAGTTSGQDAYFKNMALSQERTRSVLEYGMRLEKVQKSHSWANEKITANGLSSSRLILTNGTEDRERSRRVEFKIRTNAKQQIVKVLETLQ